MKEMPVQKYYWFGTCLRYLQDAGEGMPIYGDGFALFNIDQFLEYLEMLDLTVTRRASYRLVEFREKLAKESKKDDHLDDEQATKLASLMRELRLTLDAEIEGFTSYVVTPKRLDVQKLLGDVSSLLTPGVFGKCPEIAQHDPVEAGRCIAFERPTAAAFHILRGTESVLRYFYLWHIKQKRIDPLLWGPMVKDLRNRPKTKSHVTLYNNLDNIRLSYGNPTQHPELIYDIHEVQDLWALCTEVITRMCKITR